MRTRRLPVIDEYLEGDEVVVFVDGQVAALSALATSTLFSVGGTWTDITAIAAELVAEFGEPAPGTDPLEVARTTLESLAELRLVEWEPAPDGSGRGHPDPIHSRKFGG